MLVVSEARLAPIAPAISPADCSGGSQISSHPRTRPVIGGSPKCCANAAATCSTQFWMRACSVSEGTFGTGIGFHVMIAISVCAEIAIMTSSANSGASLKGQTTVKRRVLLAFVLLLVLVGGGSV